MSLRDELTARILAITEVEERKSRFSKGMAFFVGKREIAHFHSDDVLDVRLTRNMMRKHKLPAAGDARMHTRSKDNDWLELTVHEPQDLALATELVELAILANRDQVFECRFWTKF